MNSMGRLFGTAEHGGDGGPRDSGGVVFALDPPAHTGGRWTETILYAFGGPDGFAPGLPSDFKGRQTLRDHNGGWLFRNWHRIRSETLG
jgi:hypothetical protein